MTQAKATFNVSEFELRGLTNPYLSPSQLTDVREAEDRVNQQLDFLAQMLGWNGPNYWTTLADTTDQKRQLLGGSFGVYNRYVIPRVYEIRNWDNKLLVDRLQFLKPGRQTRVINVVVGEDTYQLLSVEEDGDKYLISIGDLTENFFTQIANNVPIQVDIPTYRPAPFYRPQVGISGDTSFLCGVQDGQLVLYPAYDVERSFPYLSVVLFGGSVYYFDQPVYYATTSNLAPAVSPSYDPDRELWYLQIPDNLGSPSPGITGYLAWANSQPSENQNYSRQVIVNSWEDPSDWGNQSVLDNFKGVWGNKGGDLPFNFVFDALTIHGFNERASVNLPAVERSLAFNEIVNYVYYQKTTISPLAPGGAKIGDLWWNDVTGALAVWFPDTTGCLAWVEIDYRHAPQQLPPAQVVFPNVTAFRAAEPGLPKGAIVRVNNTIGLDVSDNVIGVRGLLKGSGAVVMHRQVDGPYWTPEEFYYASTTNFNYDAGLLPFEVPVIIYNASGLTPDNGSYKVINLGVTVSGDYEVVLKKQYFNNTWQIYADSLLKFIANTSLFDGPLQGQMWWDYVNSDPETRAATIFYTSPHPISSISIEYPGVGLTDGVYNGVDLINLTGVGGRAQVDVTVSGGMVTGVSLVAGQGGDKYSEGDLLGPNPDTFSSIVGAVFKVTSTTNQKWVEVNKQPQSGPPAPALDLSVVRFYADGHLLRPGIMFTPGDYSLSYEEDPVKGSYKFMYYPRTFEGQVRLPVITISDALTSAYRADISDLVFSGLTYKMSPNVFNSETPLRLWKSQALQVVETVNHLEENNYLNPLLADLNTGPGPENWEKFFIRLPLEYGRNGAYWQKIALVCQNFAYWGSSIEPEKMRCPPEDDVPAIYEELFLYDEPVPDYTYVYSEPYLYSNIAYFASPESGPYLNAGIFPSSDVQFDEFSEAELIDYDALHNRQADVASPVGEGFGDWLGEYVNINPCIPLTGYFVTDLLSKGIEPLRAPVWDASIYKYAPTCENDPASYSVDANHYKIGYAYFVADASAAEDSFFDITQEAAWRYPVSQPRTSYLTPR